MNRTLRRAMAAILITFGLAGAAETADAAQQTWNCCQGLFCKVEHDIDITMTLTADKDRGKGTIKIHGLINRETKYKLHGLQRRWRWEDSSGGPYTIIMDLDGFTTFTDFTGAKPGQSREPEEKFFCRQDTTRVWPNVPPRSIKPNG